jgi:hypothetical protein
MKRNLFVNKFFAMAALCAEADDNGARPILQRRDFAAFFTDLSTKLYTGLYTGLSTRCAEGYPQIYPWVAA